jgi:hypothetical protein
MEVGMSKVELIGLVYGQQAVIQMVKQQVEGDYLFNSGRYVVG